MTTKILALTDALGNLVRFVLLPGQRFNIFGAVCPARGVAAGLVLPTVNTGAMSAHLKRDGLKWNRKPLPLARARTRFPTFLVP